MKLPLLLALLVGTQIGLSDGLILPTLVAQNGGGSFLLLYAFLKLFFILPILQAELVSGRLYRVAPFEFSFLVFNRFSAQLIFGVLLLAVVLVMSTNLFNTSWALIVGMDGLQGQLLSFRPLDQNLYWFEQSSNVDRIMSFVIAQGIMLILLGGLALKGIAYIFVIVVPLVAVFIILCLPQIFELLVQIPWSPLSMQNILVAMQHAITSSMAGLLVWYILGTKMSDRLPTGRVIIGVQLFDVLFGLAMLSISWQWISGYGSGSIDVGTVLRALIASMAEVESLPFFTAIWLFMLALVGIFSSVPLLLLVAQEVNDSLHKWLLWVTVILVMVISVLLVFSNNSDSPLMWYGSPIYDIVQRLGQGLIVPTITAAMAIWVGWFVWPNRVLQQVNPHGGFRYFLWRLVLKFIVPLLLGLVFVRTAINLVEASPIPLLIWIVTLVLLIRLYTWVRKRAIFPE